MSNTIAIKAPGLLTTVQDLGRPHLQHLGIPACGAMDPLALKLANLLVGNDLNAAGLECTLSGPVLEFHCNTVVALTGAATKAKLNGYQIPMWTSVQVMANDVLDLTEVSNGARSYLAFAGGLQVPEALGSRSTYLPLEFIPGSRRLKAGDKLPLPQITTQGVANRKLTRSKQLLTPYRATNEPVVVRLVAGPQLTYFTEETIQQLEENTYTVDSNSDRMGMRFQGPKLKAAEQGSLISDGIPWGAMQITRDGTPIIMSADRQPTGGYPKIAKVTYVDIPVLAQLRPGDKVQFSWISLDEAKSLYQQQTQAFNKVQSELLSREQQDKVYRIYLNNKLYQVGLSKE